MLARLLVDFMSIRIAFNYPINCQMPKSLMMMIKIIWKINCVYLSLVGSIQTFSHLVNWVTSIRPSRKIFKKVPRKCSTWSNSFLILILHVLYRINQKELNSANDEIKQNVSNWRGIRISLGVIKWFCLFVFYIFSVDVSIWKTADTTKLIVSLKVPEITVNSLVIQDKLEMPFFNK